MGDGRADRAAQEAAAATDRAIDRIGIAAAIYTPIEALPDEQLKRKPGRPTSYRKEFCQLVVKLGAQGMSRAQIAAALGISRATLMAWEQQFPEFLNAMHAAKDQSLAWWERAGQLGLLAGKDFNAQVYAKSMSNRFREDYTEQTRIEHSGNVSMIQLTEGTPDAEV